VAPQTASPPAQTPSGGASPATSGAAPAKDDSIDAALARETPPMKVVEAKSADGVFSVSTEASAAPTFALEDKVESLSVPIGMSEPLSCMVRSDSPSTSGVVQAVIASTQKQFKKSELGGLDVGVAGQIPYFSAELKYVVEQGGKPLLGVLKIAAFERANDTLVCLHDAPGYRATFRRVTEGIAKSLTQKGVEAHLAPLELDVAIAKIGAQPIGYAMERHYVRPDGTHGELESMSMLIPRSPTDLVNMESTKVTESSSDGVVTKIRTASMQGEDREEDLTVERKAANKYHVEGTFKGKPIKGEFKAKDPLWGNWRERDEIKKKLLAGPKLAQLAFNGYHPAVDPLAASPSTWHSTPEPMVFDTTSGGVQMRLTLDPSAWATKGTIKMGAIDMVIERVVMEKSGK
jgi:hypothetical protein